MDNSVLLVTENILGCKLLVDLAGLLLSEWWTQDTFATMLPLKTLRLSYFIEGFTWESNATDLETQRTNVKYFKQCFFLKKVSSSFKPTM